MILKQLLIGIVFISFIFTSCNKVIGKGPTVSETRNVIDFNAISLEMDATVNITHGANFKVEISAQENVLDDVLTTKLGSTLRIKHRNNMIIKSDPIVITITMPDIVDLEVAGSGTLNVNSILNTSNLDMDISGSGEINIPSITASKITVSISGSGDLIISSGTCVNVETEISGSGKIDMIYLVAKNVKSKTAGSGTTKIHAENTLDVEISGSGNVYYKGYPTITKSISGSGKLINEN